MNKKLLALAVAGAFAAPVAMADTSNVTIYGTVSMSIDHVDGGTGGTSTPTSSAQDSRIRVGSNTTRIGFKGTEDLGNGLNAFWQIENRVDIDTSSALVSARDSFVGLGNKQWGSVSFGFQNSPLKTSTRKLDLFGGGETIADYRTLFVTRDTNIRAANSVLYTSPTFSGFQVKLQTAAQQENGSTENPKFYSGSVTYDNGPIFATLAYEQNDKAFGAGTQSVFDNGRGVTGVGGYNITTAAGSTVTEAEFETWRAGFGYNFGVAKIGFAYQDTKLDVTSNGVTTLAGNGFTGSAAAGTRLEAERKSYHVSGSYNITTATQIAAQYTRAGRLESNVTTGGDTKATQYTLGAYHNMSKRTKVYGLYTRVNNGSDASYSLAGGASGVEVVNAAAANQNPRAFSVGLIHTF